MPRRRSRADRDALKNRIERELRDAVYLKQRLLEENVPGLARGVQLWVKTLAGGNKILFCGNGGSAADCQHAATELVVRLKRNRRALPALALTTDTSLLTAAANDFGFDAVFARQVEALGERGDLLVALSTSGTSSNVVKAARVARKRKLKIMALTGPAPNPLARAADAVFALDSPDTQRIQEAHTTILHILCRQSEYLLIGT